jgi:hypothetical protein
MDTLGSVLAWIVVLALLGLFLYGCAALVIAARDAILGRPAPPRSGVEHDPAGIDQPGNGGG